MEPLSQTQKTDIKKFFKKPVTDEVRVRTMAPSSLGAWVTTVVDDSPAANSGLLVDDIEQRPDLISISSVEQRRDIIRELFAQGYNSFHNSVKGFFQGIRFFLQKIVARIGTFFLTLICLKDHS